MPAVTTTSHRQRKPRPRTNAIPFHERLTCSVGDAAEATAISRSRLYELMGRGLLDSRLEGRHRVLVVASLRRYLKLPS